MTKYVEGEILNHYKLSHPHVIECKEVFLLRAYLCILLELAPNGNLWDYVIRKGRLSEAEARRYFQQLVLAVEYCHCKGIANRDIKPSNLCLSERWLLKICDFGYSKVSQFAVMDWSVRVSV